MPCLRHRRAAGPARRPAAEGHAAARAAPPDRAAAPAGRTTSALRDRPVILVQAPAGFGKTSLLAQWRREHLAHGRVVAWLSAQAQRRRRSASCRRLALAVRAGAGRPTFGHTLLEAATPAGLEGVTVWLAEVAQSALDVVLIVDEADRLPRRTREALAYLLRNAPPNLRAVVAARADCQLDIDDLVAYGQCARRRPGRSCASGSTRRSSWCAAASARASTATPPRACTS